MKFWDDFKKFAFKGNVVDMAVGVIIGGAFGKIVTSLVNDIIMPPIGKLIGGVKFDELKVVLQQATEETEAVTINYGTFIQTVLDFFIIALCIFIMVSVISAANKKIHAKQLAEEERKKKEEEEKKKNEPTTESLLTEIRDLLKEQKQ